MAERDYYEVLRQKLSIGPISAVKHKKILNFLLFSSSKPLKLLI